MKNQICIMQELWQKKVKHIKNFFLIRDQILEFLFLQEKTLFVFKKIKK